MLEKERQVVFDAGGRDAVAHVLVEPRARRIAFEARAEIAAEHRLPVFVERKFARRQQPHFVDFVNAALGIDVEAADRFDLVVEEIDPVRQRAAHRKQVDESAAEAVFARRQHLGYVRVAGDRQLFAQFVGGKLFALLEEERACGEVFDGGEAVQRGRHRHDRDVEACCVIWYSVANRSDTRS